MSAVITATPEIIVEQRVVLSNISWETYERLMKEHKNRSSSRFTYTHGNLEIYMPTQKHEKISRLFEVFFSAVAEELEIEIESLRSTTYLREELNQGVEPDCCFYIQNAEKIAGIEKLDLQIHPPPDLVVEVDVTSSSINKFPIYAALGVPEIWLYKNEQIKIYLLSGNDYVETKESLALPQVTGEILTDFLNQSQTEKRSVWLKKVREWIRSNQKSDL